MKIITETDLYRNGIKKTVSHRYFPILVLITISICAGVFILGDYGESWDEENNKIYGRQSLAAYSYWWGEEVNIEEYLGPTNQRYRGPAYPMMASLVVSFFRGINDRWFSIDLWHFVNFLSFHLGVLFFYVISKRVMGQWAALGTSILFTTQPLLWGHSFINSKDIPFMVFFLGSIAFGLKMVESFSLDQAADKVSHVSKKGGRNFTRLVEQNWAAAGKLTKRLVLLFSGLLLVILLTSGLIRDLLIRLIERSYQADPATFLGFVFSRFAENSNDIQIESYISKGVNLFERVELFLIIFLAILNLAFAYSVFRKTPGSIWKRVLFQRKHVYLLAASLMFGLASSTRILGFWAGALVIVYFLMKVKRAGIPFILAYISISILVTYATWPFLWADPIQHFIESLQVSSDFDWRGNVLFGGVIYKSYDLSRSYLPVLLLLQFTEPVLVLFLTGIVSAAFRTFRERAGWKTISIISLWFLIPFLLVIVFQPIMYNNFRHFLFILPPIFIFSGIGLDMLFKRVYSKAFRLVLVLFVVFPGLYWGVKLHPYQYVYYNSLTGGVNGAFRQYELDYWVTSYREATLFLNEQAPHNAKVLVEGPRRVFLNYAREDLDSKWFGVDEIDEITDPLYLIITTRSNKDRTLFPDAEIAYKVVRDGADLAYVKKIK